MAFCFLSSTEVLFKTSICFLHSDIYKHCLCSQYKRNYLEVMILHITRSPSLSAPKFVNYFQTDKSDICSTRNLLPLVTLDSPYSCLINWCSRKQKTLITCSCGRLMCWKAEYYQFIGKYQHIGSETPLLNLMTKKSWGSGTLPSLLGPWNLFTY